MSKLIMQANAGTRHTKNGKKIKNINKKEEKGGSIRDHQGAMRAKTFVK